MFCGPSLNGTVHTKLYCQRQCYRCQYPACARLGEIPKVHANHCQCLNILPSVATQQLIEQAEGVMVMQVRLNREVRLLYRVFPIPGSVLEEHNGEYHMNYNSLGSSGTEVWIIIEPGELPLFSLSSLKALTMVTY
jgi:hypothetical protein